MRETRACPESRCLRRCAGAVALTPNARQAAIDVVSGSARNPRSAMPVTSHAGDAYGVVKLTQSDLARSNDFETLLRLSLISRGLSILLEPVRGNWSICSM